MKINERLIFTILISYFFENTEGIIGGWEAARFRDAFYQTSFYDKFSFKVITVKFILKSSAHGRTLY